MIDKFIARLSGRTQKPQQQSQSQEEPPVVSFEQVCKLVEHLTKVFQRQNMYESLALKIQKTDAVPLTVSEAVGREPRYKRLFVSNSFWALVFRHLDNISLEAFLFPSVRLVDNEQERLSDCKLKLEFDKETGNWKSGSFPVDPAELTVLIKSLFRDFIKRSSQDAQSIPEYVRLPLSTNTAPSLANAVQEIIREKHELAQRLVDEHEEIYHSIAREIHDAIIGNVLTLKRLLAEEKHNAAELQSIVDEVHGQLREVCNELVPRDLKDCGLQLVVDDLVDRFARRTGLDIVAEWSCSLPSLPLEVQLHIYRIIQECLNNIAKHSNADRAWVRFRRTINQFQIIIEDNGNSDAPAKPKENRRGYFGNGTGILAERTSLINRLFPATVKIDPRSMQGFRVVLELEVDASKDSHQHIALPDAGNARS